MPLSLRPARPGDAAGPALLYVSAAPYYDAFAGSRERALEMLAALWAKPGHTAASALCTVAERDGAVVGILSAFPAEDGDALARRFLRLSCLRLGVWRLPAVLRHLRASTDVMPVPPARSLYVDAIAVDEAQRRHGVATALLEHADADAARRGLRGVALDTGLENTGAQSLYERYGFRRTGERHASSARVAQAVGGRGFVSYFKPL